MSQPPENEDFSFDINILITPACLKATNEQQDDNAGTVYCIKRHNSL